LLTLSTLASADHALSSSALRETITQRFGIPASDGEVAVATQRLIALGRLVKGPDATPCLTDDAKLYLLIAREQAEAQEAAATQAFLAGLPTECREHAIGVDPISWTPYSP